MGKRFKAAKPEKGIKAQVAKSNNITPDQLHPVFCLRHIQKTRCLSNCTKAEKASFADTIHKLSKLPWFEIKKSPRHASGFEIIKSNSLNVSLPEHLASNAKILAFRCFGKKPMLGYREEHVFHILWLDRNHDAY